MKKFIFKLQALLNIKLSLEKQRKIELAMLIGELNQLCAEYDRRSNYYKDTETAFDELKKINIRPSEFAEYTSYLEQIAEELQQMDYFIKEKEKSVESKKEETEDIMKERKVLEKLRESKFEAYLDDIAKEEAKVVEEIVSFNLADQANRS